MTEVTLVGIAGWARSGKDTAAQGLVDIGWTKAAFADPLKRALEILNPVVYTEGHWDNDKDIYSLSDALAYGDGWNDAKDDPDWGDEVRRLLQTFGTEVGRNLFGEDFWVKQALDGAYPYTVFSDVRFKNEADAIRAAGGIVIRVQRDGVFPVNGHSSETDLDDYDFDYEITNNWTKESLQDDIRFHVEKETSKRRWDFFASNSAFNRSWSDDGLESDPDVNGSTAYSAGEWADPEWIPGAYHVPSRLPAAEASGPAPVRGLHSPEGQGYVERPDSARARYWRDGGAC